MDMNDIGIPMTLLEAQRFVATAYGIPMNGKDREYLGEKPPNVIKAEAATMSELAPYLPRPVPVGGHTDIQMVLKTSSSLSVGARDALYGMWEHNIAHLVLESSLQGSAEGTDMETEEDEKREEMFDTKTRFIILLKRAPKAPDPVAPEQPSSGGQLSPAQSITTAGASPTKKKKKKKAEKLDFGPNELVGYCSFRFDAEETLDDDVMAEVIYCYEMQLAGPARGKGLGRMLMKELEDIGRRREMQRAMLTCLTTNMPAARFYVKIGYARDEIDPSLMNGDRMEDEQVLDYWILSKSLRIESIEEVAQIEEVG